MAGCELHHLWVKRPCELQCSRQKWAHKRWGDGSSAHHASTTTWGPMLKAQVQWYMLRITTLGRQRQGWGWGEWILKTHWSANIDKLVNSGLSERLSKKIRCRKTHIDLWSLYLHPYKYLYMHADTQKENLWAFLTLLMCTGRQGFLLHTPWEFQNYSQ